jgi:uncharacterized protein YndB with AHSA1/START domain
MDNKPFIIERVYNAPIETVWKALTDSAEMKKWYFDLPGFKAEVGYEFEFLGGPPEKSYRHLCRITSVIPNKKISYTWRYDGYEGNSEVSFELFKEDKGTKLVLTHHGLDTFPKSNPHFAKKNFEEGWTHFATISLKEYLEKV